jgi:hypothetical protein
MVDFIGHSLTVCTRSTDSVDACQNKVIHTRYLLEKLGESSTCQHARAK